MSEIIKYQGVTYPSLKALANAYDIEPRSLYNCKARGLSIDDVIEYQKNKKPIIFRGKTYDSLSILAETFGLSTSIFNYHMDSNNLSELDRVMSELLQKEPIKYKGKEYKNLAHVCSTYGLNTSIVWRRISRGMTLDEAIKTPIKPHKRDEEIVFRGNSYNTYRDAINTYGWDYISISHLKRKLKPVEVSTLEALELLVSFMENYKFEKPNLMTQIPSVVYKGVWYDKESSFLKLFDIRPYVFQNHRRLNPDKNILEVLELMKQHQKTIFIDKQTNQPATAEVLQEKYGYAATTLLKRGLIYRTQALTYPQLQKYKPDRNCVAPEYDFNKYLQSKGFE